MKAQILVVDDDAGSRNALADLLRDEGYSVAAVAGGEEALAFLRQSPQPQLIVMDLMMPGLDGWDFRHEQKRDPKLAAIPIVAVSAAGKLPDADAQFRKPLNVEQFLETVRRYVRPSRR
ncbi:MAG TPA: response regulator [Vicinamibacterales bacterium]|jgi:CheY-like chemotaxis protein